MRKYLLIFFLLIVGCSSIKKPAHVIRFWQFWSDINTKPVIEELVREFEGQNPGIKVEITDLTWANGHDKLVISFAAKDPPDIMELGSDWVAEFSSNNLLAEIKSNLPENFLLPARWNDKTYALPWLLDTRIFYVNADLIKRAKTKMPSDWPELHAACIKIDRLGENYFGFGCNSAEKHRLYKKFLPFLWSNGGDVLSPDGSRSGLASKEAIGALDFYLDLCDCGIIESQTRIEEYFREGKVGFVISGGWLLRRLKKTPPEFKYQLLPVFRSGGGTGSSFLGGEFLAVYAISPQRDMAVKLAEFLTASGNAQKLCDAAGFGFPPYDSLVTEDPDKKKLAYQLRHSKATFPTPIWVDIEQDLEDAIEAAMYKHGTAAEVLAKASQIIDSKIKANQDASAK